MPQVTIPNQCYVFLGGPCDTTTWRTDIAIPLLEQYALAYYNPQTVNGKPEMEASEQKAKGYAEDVLFVLTGDIRGNAALVEASILICEKPFDMHLVIQDITDEQAITMGMRAAEQNDNNYGRSCLRELAELKLATCYETIEQAILAIVEGYLP